jgi:transglutaminase-like putative cysteine protease
VSGFSDEVELGQFGRIETSDRVVLRVRFPEGVDPGPRYMLGAVFDRYERGVWSRSLGGHYWLPSEPDGFNDLGFARQWKRVAVAPTRGLEAIEYEVFQEPLGDSRVIFTIPLGAAMRPIAAELDRYQGNSRQFHTDGLGNPSYRGHSNSSLAFRARSLVSSYTPGQLASLDPDDDWVRQHYLQLPADLDPRVAALARSVAGQAQGRLAQVKAVEDHLLANYAYSLDGGHNPADPLADFLFGIKRGHCEYFSTAMVLMLRSLDIPARSANGYRSGKFNRFGGFRAYAEADAHSWVQVWFPAVGWQDFEPTPGGREPLPPAFLDALDQWMDALRLQWYRWVIEYDLENQLQVYSGILKAFGGKGFELQGHSTPSELKAAGKRFKESLFSARNAAILGGLVLLGLLVGLWRGKLWRGHFGGAPGAKLERRVRRILAAKGNPIPPHETLSGYGQRLRPEDHYRGNRIQSLGEELDALRWSQEPMDPAAAKALLRKVQALLVRRKG